MSSKPYPIPQQILQDLVQVEQELTNIVMAGNGVVAEASLQTLKAGGKRLRPALVLMSGMVGGYDLNKLMPAAVSSELIHMASLMHDDVLDGAGTRRGIPTVNSIWGERVAIAVGDYLFATAFEILSRNDIRSVEIMVSAAIELSLGEFDQMISAYVAEQSIEDYLQKARRKTAALFAACCEVGSYLSGATESQVKALTRYGENLGIAFQIYDDVLDIVGGDATGKAKGVDIRAGMVTVPVLYALDKLGYNSRLADIITGDEMSDEDVDLAIEMIIKSDAITRTKDTARSFVGGAISQLELVSNPDAVAVFKAIGEFVIDRYH